ncbi:hypothetical protein P186_0773 [Pyrobaculum ferrireducens]|uniref:Uncharacterized protein n=1 Tax=Pyrobaculum ferrireducens TaxID=1104324 RepID=G7VAI0_9CREN|nr:hypothetical protein P186_0773 [Pyrobaculum ferrireducens]
MATRVGGLSTRGVPLKLVAGRIRRGWARGFVWGDGFKYVAV